MEILLPDRAGTMRTYSLPAAAAPDEPLRRDAPRRILAAAHVVADPLSAEDPSGAPTLDWSATLAFRRHLAGLGLGIAEAMDTAQRGTGLDWTAAIELIGRTRAELPEATVFSGAGTDHLSTGEARTPDDICAAYLHQVEQIQALGGDVILMASRELARIAQGPEDYLEVYGRVLRQCDRPVILHWLGQMFDPALAGYWGSAVPDAAMETVLTLIAAHADRIDGIKLSLLDSRLEVEMRRRLPRDVVMYTGDDFNYPELIAGDEQGASHALLGIFDPLAPLAARAINRLGRGDVEGYRAILDPTVPLARALFSPPTRFYKTGVVFLAWLNGFQDHFVMPAGAQAMRPLPYFVECFRLAADAGVLRDPEMAAHRMQRLLALYGL